MVSSMKKDAAVLALANPIPEIMPDVAKKQGLKLLELVEVIFQIKLIM